MVCVWVDAAILRKWLIHRFAVHKLFDFLDAEILCSYLLSGAHDECAGAFCVCALYKHSAMWRIFALCLFASEKLRALCAYRSLKHSLASSFWAEFDQISSAHFALCALLYIALYFWNASAVLRWLILMRICFVGWFLSCFLSCFSFHCPRFHNFMRTNRNTPLYLQMHIKKHILASVLCPFSAWFWPLFLLRSLHSDFLLSARLKIPSKVHSVLTEETSEPSLFARFCEKKPIFFNFIPPICCVFLIFDRFRS